MNSPINTQLKHNVKTVNTVGRALQSRSFDGHIILVKQYGKHEHNQPTEVVKPHALENSK